MKAAFSLTTAVFALLLLSTCADAQTPPEQSSPQRNLPYAAVHNPQFVPASEATFVQPDDRVMIGQVAKAYPAGILSQHGLVEDQSPQGPIAITW